MTQPAIAQCFGVSLSTVNRAHMACDAGGIKALKPKPNGGRKHENMTLAQEKALLARFAQRSGAGEMLNNIRARQMQRPKLERRHGAGAETAGRHIEVGRVLQATGLG